MSTEESGFGVVTATVPNLPGWAEESHEKAEDGRFSDRYPNLGLSKYKLEAV